MGNGAANIPTLQSADMDRTHPAFREGSSNFSIPVMCSIGIGIQRKNFFHAIK